MNEETCKLDIKIRPLLCEVSGLHWTNTWYGENLVLSLCLNRITSYMHAVLILTSVVWTQLYVGWTDPCKCNDIEIVYVHGYHL